MDTVYIQVQSETGGWQTHSVSQNNSQLIKSVVDSLRWQFPNARIRAVNENGNVVDIF